MATMMFSLTPLRLSSIMRSDVRSKFGILEAMIRTTVFSLKPALTSLMTSALVIGPSSCLLCARTPTAHPISRQKVISVVGKKNFIAHPLALRIRHIVLSTWLPARKSVAFSNFLNVVLRLSVRRDVPAIFEHRAFAGIITRQHQFDFPAEHVHQFPHVLGSGPDVFSRVERLANA